MTAETAPQSRATLVVAAAALCLVMILISSFVYRMTNPSLTLVARSGDQGKKGQGMDSGAMTDVAAHMAMLQEDPRNMEALLNLGVAFMRMEAWDRALVFWNRALDVDPKNRMALNQKGVALFQMDRHEEGAQAFGELVALDPDDYRAHYNLAIVHKYYLNDPTAAREHFQAVVRIEPEEPGLLEEVARELELLEASQGS
ncbi:MAG: tetratricopeptide repeat protein [Deltaproteobacteria bacterium]|nr:tetratricopeptide repeat protein [Deltaproteobacteria bacterium]